MKKLALLTALLLAIPTLAVAQDGASISLSIPGTDKASTINITFPKGTAWDKGDLVTVTFDATEAGAMEKPQIDCGFYMHRRFNPGQAFFDKCQDIPLEQRQIRLYNATFSEKPEIEWLKDLPDAWIPGFLMPLLPSSHDAAAFRLASIFSQISVNGVSCKFEKGCKIASSANLRQITVSVPKDIEMMKEMSVQIPSSLGLMCPQTPGPYTVSVDAKVKGSAAIDIVTPKVSRPSFAVNPAFPNEPSVWRIGFDTGKAGRLDSYSQIMLRLPKGFCKIQKEYPHFSAQVNGYMVDRGMIRLASGTDSDHMLIPCPAIFEAGSRIEIELNAMNPGEGDVSCLAYTTSEHIPVEAGKAKIEFSTVITSAETTAGLPTTIMARFKSEGHKEGDNLLAVLPSEILKTCKVYFNGKEIGNPTLGLKTAQFALPYDIPQGAFCMLKLTDVLNPLANSSIKISIINSTYEIPWSVSPYQTRLAISTIPPVANKPCSYAFHITPPPDLLDVERKLIKIAGPWNRILRPAIMKFQVLAGTETARGEFFPETNTIEVRLSTEFENMKPLKVEIPFMAGFGSPDRSGEFTVTIAGREIRQTCKVQPAPPAVSYSVKSESGAEIGSIGMGWFKEPVTVSVITSSGTSNVNVSGLGTPVSSQKSDLSFKIDQTMITEDLKVTVSDVGGATTFSIPPIRIDLEKLNLSVTNPFEKTGVSPTQKLIVGVETNRKIIPTGTMFMVIEPEIEVLVNDMAENAVRLNSKISPDRPEAKFSIDIPVTLRLQANSVKVTVTDQTGRTETRAFSVRLDVKNVALEFDAKQSQAVDPGMSREILFKTEPETTVHIGEKTFVSDMAGKVKVTLDINPGFNVFFTQLITKENVSYEYQLFIFGKRTIKMKSEQKFVLVDGKRVEIKVPPTTITYRFKVTKGKDIVVPVAYAPLRVLAENLFSTVNYNSETKTITITQKQPDKDKKVVFIVGEPTATIDGVPYRIDKNYDIPPIIKNGSAMIPMRFAAVALGAQVGFDTKTKEILISWPDPKEMGNIKATPGKAP